MSVRSLLSLGLLATAALAAPPAYSSTKTVTKTITKTAKASTVTQKVTITAPASCPTSQSTSHSTSHSTSTSHTSTKSGSSSSASGSSSASSSVSSASTTSSSSSASNTNPTTTLIATATATNYGLNDAAKATGKLWFGTAADIPGTGEAADSYYTAEFNNTHDFGEATPANTMKWFATEPEQGVFNYTGGDYFLDFAEATGKLVRCHNLVWKSQLPTWITAPAVPWTNATLSAALRNHVTNLVTHFGDRCYSWDVVNEALSDSPAGSWDNSSIFYDVIGPEYFFIAFDAATKAVKANSLNVKLYYNDYNIEYLGNKSIAAQGLVQQLHARGIQIDGVGLESHFIAGSTPDKASQVANMEAFTALGVNVAVTELDVRLYLPPNATTEAQQVVDYYNTVAACVAVEGCIGVTVWDFVDTYSWIPMTFAGQGYGDLFLQPDGANTPLVKKAAYDGCLEALTGAPEAP